MWVCSCVPMNACLVFVFFNGLSHLCACVALRRQIKTLFGVVMSAVVPVLKKDQGHAALWVRFSLAVTRLR